MQKSIEKEKRKSLPEEINVDYSSVLREIYYLEQIFLTRNGNALTAHNLLVWELPTYSKVECHDFLTSKSGSRN